MSIKDWIEIREKGRTGPCPRCGANRVRFQYGGDKESRIGYLLIWCDACLHGVNVSRVRIPDDATVLPSGISREEFLKVVPRFTIIDG